MIAIKRIIVIGFLLVTVAAARSPQAEPPLADSRLTVHTLVREDIFAGFMGDDMDRFARGEKNIDLLLAQRPAQRANLLAWKGGATLYRAVRAYENKHADEFKKLYQQTLDNFAEAGKLNTGNDGVAAVTGGSFALFADRLPKEYRAAAWASAYDNYLTLYKLQAGIIDKLPVHLKGEVLAGLATAAQRTGRKDETAQYVDKMLAVLGGTPYEPMAQKWKANPESASKTSLLCMTCHDAGRLGPTLGRLNNK
ncbi:MAG TPA: hypothetical protein VLM38_07950 [Blastocatellia bacterium]|nr:hypothetical protein [Blastocatellia bacterium]